MQQGYAAGPSGFGAESSSSGNNAATSSKKSSNSGSKKAGSTSKGAANAGSGSANANATAGGEADDEKKKRSSRACDNCKRQKCRCVRVPNEQGQEEGPCQNCKINGVDCTFLGASKKRGPPKGYIEAIENRMHRMEALLGGLLNNDDPRAQALLEELVGDIEARELLSKDLAVAAAVGRDNAPTLKTWQRPGQTPGAGQSVKREESVAPGAGRSGSRAPITQRGFDLSGVQRSGSGSMGSASPFADFSALPSQNDGSAFSFMSRQNNFIPEEDVLATDGSQASPAFSNATGLMDGSLDFGSNAGTFGNDGYGSGNIAIPGSSYSGSMPGPSSTFSTSPRTNQRRRLDQGGLAGSSDVQRSAQSLFAMQAGRASSGSRVAAPNTINHTGAATYTLSGTSSTTSPGALAAYASGESDTVFGTAGENGKSPSADGLSPNAAISAASGNTSQQLEGPLSELADVVGQLSLDENREVRYHGRSSGLYLISKSSRYQDFFWRFPKAGVWPPAEDESNMVKTEAEIVRNTNATAVLPDKRTSDHLMELYWIYVHPHLPLLYRSLFVRQYRNTVHGSESAEGDTSGPAMASGGKVPTLLLLAVYATAARYSDAGGARKEGVYWKAGEEYAKKAKDMLFDDFGSSRLSTCQALLLLAYREIGCGAMAKSWTFVGMAVRMAQDLGLFRDVDKWFLPVNAFGYEEKQTRKRVWWSCVVMDRYVSAYIGRPMAIYERDYDVALPAEDEPDEHDIWRPIRPDGTDWSSAPIAKANGDSPADPYLSTVRNFPQGVKSNSLSCFNHTATLSVMFSRIISNLYAIRVRVLGQNSETLLAHLDQALASWFLKLPPHLQYNSGSKKTPPPHVLALHCQFFAALILLHRPFIPAHGSVSLNETFPSHSICTTAAAAISNIVTLYSKTYGLRQAIPFLTYYVFSAGIMHVYNSTYDPSLAPTAKAHLHKCMRALQEMEITWPSASRQRELLLGLVDLRDVDIDIETTMSSDSRGRKREAENQEVDANGSRPGSGAATPAAISEAYRRVGRGGTIVPGFASAGLAANGQSQNQQQRRTASMSAASRRRHNSVTAATLRQNSFNAPASGPGMADSSSLQTPMSASAALPSTDFTFISPATQPINLPGIPAPSPALTSTSGFDFSGMSPGNAFAASSGFSIPHQQQQQNVFTASDGAHIHNILGLSEAMNIPYSPPSADTAGQMSQSLPGTAEGIPEHTSLFSNAPSGTAFGNFTDLLTDPFWLSMQQDINSAEQVGASDQANDTAMAGQGNSPGVFGDQTSAFFGANFSSGATPDDWHRFLQTTPGDSTGNGPTS